jgi:predicted dehydrogenase
MKNGQQKHNHRVRYAVVGLGHIAQVAVLPAFKHAKENSVLTTLVSNDPVKLRELGKKYGVTRTYSCDQFDACVNSDEVDAVYIALPNHLHCEFALRTFDAGRHVLCEKPMAVTESECRRMIAAAADRHARLMIAYRLHFEEANLEAIEIGRSGQLGELRYFSSNFSMQVKPDDIRLKSKLGGGTLYDIGVYCINAARCLFQAEPLEVFATARSGADSRFHDVEEMVSATMRFPGDRLASFTCSFGAADVSSYRLVGTKGDLKLDPAYGYAGKLARSLTVGGKTVKKVFSKRDQFAAELIHFSDAILKGQAPEPSGLEGLADVRVIEALYRSAEQHRPVTLEPVQGLTRPSLAQEIHKPPVQQPALVHASSPHADDPSGR